MTFTNPIAPKTNRLLEKSSQIKAWVRDEMNLSEDIPITIAELACQDINCPDVETVIGVLEPGQPVTTVRVHLPIASVQQADVSEAVHSKA